MSVDLDKMMEKLKSKKKDQEEKPKEEVVKEEKVDDEDQEEEETIKEKEEVEQSVENEVAILQNDGVFRRELLIAIKELVSVQKVNTQELIDLNKLVGGALNGKKE